MEPLLSSERRSFIAGLKPGFIALAAAGVATAQEKAAPAAAWAPARHDKDDWLEKPSTKHRMVFDTKTADGLGESLVFATNYIGTNGAEYGLSNSDLSVVIITRHRSTPFAYNDAMWAKYGATFVKRTQMQDPKTKEAPKLNLYNANGYSDLPNGGATLKLLADEGAQFAVCSLSTRGIAAMVAAAGGGDAGMIFTELTSNLISGARMVPAGIIALNRAQERGYSVAIS